MYNANKPSADELPSSAQLLRSTVIAMAAAVVILVTIVLPSEYGIDPTGVGRTLGLTEMGQIKTQLAEEAAADRRMAAEVDAARGVAEATPDATQAAVVGPTAPEAAPREPAASDEPVASDRTPAAPAAAAEPEPGIRSDEITIILAPGQGTEVKLVMEAGARADFEWSANGGLLNYDTHGDGGGRSISYEKGRGVPGDKGVLEAAFDGNHGWFWRNRTNGDVTMTLRTQGAYRELKRVL